MGVYAGPNPRSISSGVSTISNAKTTNLLVAIDAANVKSYSGSGSSWVNLISSPNFTLTNCTYNQTEIVGNGTTASIKSNSNINLSSYSNFSIVFGFKSSNYQKESVLFEYGLSNYFYYFPTGLSTSFHTTLGRTVSGISTFSPQYNTSSVPTLVHTTLGRTVSGISTFSPAYNTSSAPTSGHTTLGRTVSGISSFNALKNNGFVLKLENNNIISNTVIDNKIYPILTSNLNTTTHNLISLIYSNLNTSSSSVSMYQGSSLVGTVGLTTISFTNSLAYLLSIGSVNKLSNSSIKYMNIYNQSLSAGDVATINASYGSRT